MQALGVEIVQVPEDPDTQLETARAEKAAQLGQSFTQAEAFGHFYSALGFEVDATERSNRDVAGLITKMSARGENESVFCDYGNTMRTVSLEELQKLQIELIEYGQMLYARKWELRAAIQSAQSLEALRGIDVNFNDLPAPSGFTV